MGTAPPLLYFADNGRAILSRDRTATRKIYPLRLGRLSSFDRIMASIDARTSQTRFLTQTPRPGLSPAPLVLRRLGQSCAGIAACPAGRVVGLREFRLPEPT